MGLTEDRQRVVSGASSLLDIDRQGGFGLVGGECAVAELELAGKTLRLIVHGVFEVAPVADELQLEIGLLAGFDRDAIRLDCQVMVSVRGWRPYARASRDTLADW